MVSFTVLLPLNYKYNLVVTILVFDVRYFLRKFFIVKLEPFEDDPPQLGKMVHFKEFPKGFVQ